MADSLNKKDFAQQFYNRAQYYKNLYDPQTGFLRAKVNNRWFGPFFAEEVNFNYTEANAWQYSLFVPQDIEGHIELMGGKENYSKHLDKMFSANSSTSGREQVDTYITEVSQDTWIYFPWDMEMKPAPTISERTKK